jgi:Tfp pilus assembly protein PilF
VYSLAAPWLAQRRLASASTAAQVKQAHSYDPLSTDALTEWAAFEDGAGRLQQAADLYRRAVSLEPQNSETWYALGAFYYDHRAWRAAYHALDKAWKYDRFGPAGEACGLLDQARHKALGVWPPSCPGGRRRTSP